MWDKFKFLSLLIAGERWPAFKQLPFLAPSVSFHVLMINPGLETDLHNSMQKWINIRLHLNPIAGGI